jgi:TM2 domain-containing membrane protein YozV/DNA-directed RNA polymerase subunit RPC12/RpoP
MVSKFLQGGGKPMPLIQCPECSQEVSDRAINCPKCGFPIAKPELQPSTSRQDCMILDNEDKIYVCTICPKCGKEGKINRSSVIPTGTGYYMKGTGTCGCGFTFDKVMPNGTNPVLVAQAYYPSRRSTAGLLAILLGGIGIHKIYLGEAGIGLLYILFCWTFIPAILGFFTGIGYFQMTDDVFNRTVDRTHPCYRKC